MVFVRAAMWGMSDMLSPVDLAGWEAVFDQNGIRGLHVTRLQDYRDVAPGDPSGDVRAGRRTPNGRAQNQPWPEIQ
jgi:hypothetical protein